MPEANHTDMCRSCDRKCSEHTEHVRAINEHDKKLNEHARKLDAQDDAMHELREKHLSENSELRLVINRLEANIERLSSLEEQNARRINDMEDKLATLEARPAKNWDMAVTIVVTAVLTTIVNMIINQVGLISG